MKWKTTVLLIALTLGIGTYISLYEIKQPSPEERQQHAKEILELQAHAVTQVTVDIAEATSATLTREGETWKLARPNVANGVRANADLINRILAALSPLVAERILTGNADRPLDPAAYGLEPAKGWLSVVTNRTPITLWFGETTAVQNNRYLTLSNRPEIFVISSELFQMVGVPIEQYRDPQLLPFDAWGATGCSIASANTNFALTRQGNEWRLSQPIEDRADRTAVTSLLSRLAGMQISRFVEDAPQLEQHPEWGLDQPSTQVTLQPSETATPMTIAFGKPLAEEVSLIYTKRSDEPSVYAVASSDVEGLLQDPQELRSKACFDFFTSAVLKVELAHKGSTWTIERKETQWQDASSGTVLETPRVEELLNKLADLRVEEFVEDRPTDLKKYGLLPAESTLTVWSSDAEEPQKLLIGDTIEGTPNRYGAIEHREVVVRLPEIINEVLATPIEQLKTPPPTPENGDSH